MGVQARRDSITHSQDQILLALAAVLNSGRVPRDHLVQNRCNFRTGGRRGFSFREGFERMSRTWAVTILPVAAFSHSEEWHDVSHDTQGEG